MPDRKKMVYVVEDDEEQLFILRMLLSDAGYEVVTEVSADRVMEGIRELRPDLALLDVMLPSSEGIDGFQLCTQIKQDPELSRTRVIVVTAIVRGQGAGKEKILEQTGADDFLTKPYDPPVLIERIEKLLSGHS